MLLFKHPLHNPPLPQKNPRQLCINSKSPEYFTYLKRIHHPVKKLNDKKRGHFCLDHGHEEDLVSIHAQKIMVRGGDHRGHIFSLRSSFLSLEEVVANWTADHALPVFLQENVSRGVDEKKAVNHCWSRWRPTAEDQSPTQRSTALWFLKSKKSTHKYTQARRISQVCSFASRFSTAIRICCLSRSEHAIS